jgi:mRNA-degrading endonuclease toxin of MazEF toxin-antitoxin module
MTTAHPRVLQINQDKQAVVDEAGAPMEEFVVLTDEHGGVHLLPRHFYEEVQRETQQIKQAVADRRTYLRNVRAKMPEEKTEGDLSELTREVRGYTWARQRTNRRFWRMGQPVRGGVYYVRDDIMTLLPDVLRSVIHTGRRFFVVLSGDETDQDEEWPIVSGCPISSSTTLKTKFDVKLGAGEGGVQKKCWVRIPALQSIEKQHLQDFSGLLDPSRIDQIDAALFLYLGQL